MRVDPWALAGVPETAGCYLWLIWGATAMEAEATAEAKAARRMERKQRRTRAAPGQGLGV